MNKKIKTNNKSLEVTSTNSMIVRVGCFKFVQEETFPWIDIYIEGDEAGTDEFIEQVDTETTAGIVEFDKLETFALNWVFNNVEIVNDIKEKETAQEVPVQEQSIQYSINVTTNDPEGLKNTLKFDQ